jgi:septal ring factor EnvC (AmiA/AmiB activator)
MKKENKVKTSFTLLPRIKNLIIILSEKLGISQTAVIQMAIIELFKKEKEVTITQDQFEILAQGVAKQFEVNNKSIAEAMTAIANDLNEISGQLDELESRQQKQYDYFEFDFNPLKKEREELER